MKKSKDNINNQHSEESCKYKQLYEGSQASLADMAAKQVTALSRVSRIRSGILEQLRRQFPNQFLLAERHTGAPLNTLTDDAVLAFLVSFIELRDKLPEDLQPAKHSYQNEMQDVTQIKQALAQTGFGIPAEVLSIAELIKAINVRSVKTINKPDPFASPGSSANPLPPLMAGHTPSLESPDEILAQILLTQDEQAEAMKTQAEAVNTEAAPIQSKTSAWGQPKPQQSSAVKDQSASATVSPVPTTASAKLPSQIGQAADRIVDHTTDQIVDHTTDQDEQILRQERLYAQEIGHGLTEQTVVKDTQEMDPADVLAAAKNILAGTLPVNLAPVMPLRPEIGVRPDSAARSKPSARRVKTQAVPASDSSYDVVPETIVEHSDLDAGVNERIKAAVLAGVPTFTSMLLPLAGSIDTLMAWEESLRLDDNAQLRLIPARKRHAALGSLVYPISADLFIPQMQDKHWATFVKKYHGAKLFELGVLLMAVNKNVVTVHCEEHVAVIRVKDSRGVAALIIALEPDLTEGSVAREQAGKALTSLSKERLTMIAILASNEPAYLEIPNFFQSYIKDNELSFSYPVVSAKSWEYAASNGLKVELLLK